jgi:hypothetical protein
LYQKDYLGGGIALGGYLAGLGLMIGGYAVMLNSVVSAAENPEAPPFDMFEKALPLYISGGIVLSASQIFGLVRTFVFPSSYNNKLKNALDIRGLVMNIEPSMNITDRGYELTLVNFRY